MVCLRNICINILHNDDADDDDDDDDDDDNNNRLIKFVTQFSKPRLLTRRQLSHNTGNDCVINITCSNK